MSKVDIAKKMINKYGFNPGWLGEGFHHTDPGGLIKKVKGKWPNLSDDERKLMSQIYDFPGGFCEMHDVVTESGEHVLDVNVKTENQLIWELTFAGVVRSSETYNDYLEANADKLSDLDKAIIGKLVQEWKYTDDLEV